MNEEIYQEEEVIEPIDDRADASEALEVELSTDITISDDELLNGNEDKKPEYFETLLERLKYWASDGKILLHYHGLYFVQIIGENTYYLANDDGTISSFAPYQFDENAIKADEEIVQGYDGKYYFASQCPEKPAPTKEEQKKARQAAYKAEVDPLMAEYNRKKTFNLFEEGEEEALLAEVNAKAEEIKQRFPYPVEETNSYESEEVIEDGLQGEEKEIEENKQLLQYPDSDNEVVELYSMEI